MPREDRFTASRLSMGFPPSPFGASSVYGLSFRGKSAVFPLASGRAALCRRLALYLFQSENALAGAENLKKPPARPGDVLFLRVGVLEKKFFPA